MHILENPNKGEKAAAMRILGLVIASQRPLLWKEIKAFFYVDIDTETADPDFQLLDVSKYYCGSPLETATCSGSMHLSDDIVDVVHETARG